MSVESKMTVSGCDTGLPQVCTTRWYWADKSLTSPSAGHSKRLVIAVFPLELPQQQKNEKSDTQNLNFTLRIQCPWALSRRLRNKAAS